MLDGQFYSLFREPLLIWVGWIGRNQELFRQIFVKMTICIFSSTIRDLEFFVCSHGAMVAALGAAWCWTCRARKRQRRGERSLFGENLVSSLYAPEFWCQYQHPKTAIFSGEFPFSHGQLWVSLWSFSNVAIFLLDFRLGSLVMVPQESLYGPSRVPGRCINERSIHPYVHEIHAGISLR